jgi:hypothetical protein
MPSLSIGMAAQLLLSRLAGDAAFALGAMLDEVAAELARSIPVYGLEGRTGVYRAIDEQEIRNALFKYGAVLMKTADGGVFTQMTVRRSDFSAYLAGRLDPKGG